MHVIRGVFFCKTARKYKNIIALLYDYPFTGNDSLNYFPKIKEKIIFVVVDNKEFFSSLRLMKSSVVVIDKEFK